MPEALEDRERISLIATVLNERESLGHWLASILAQKRAPDELVVVDAGSTDGTIPALQDWAAQAPFPVHVVIMPGCTRSQGRNAAIRQAAHDRIATTDAGCRLDPNWLGNLAAALADPEVEVAAGWFRPWLETPLDLRFAVLMIPALEEISPERFLPSSRSIAFRREAWSRVGGYPDLLNYGEDTRFDLDLKAAGARFRFVPDAYVYWRPASSLKQLLRVARNYGLGDGQARIASPHRRALIRYVLAPLALLACLGAKAYAGALLLVLLGGIWLLRASRSFRRRARAFSRDAARPWRLSFADQLSCLTYLILLDLTRTWGYLRGSRLRRADLGSVA